MRNDGAVKREGIQMKYIDFPKPSHCMDRKNILYFGQEVADMANEDKKDFNAMLHDSKDMPKLSAF